MSSDVKTVLVVDDEELLRNAIVFQFKREGFNVVSASNGTEAFEIIKTTHIDAVVSDIQMPGGNGIELLKNVKDFNANIPVLVFITAFADITESEAYDLGANAIFTKPFDRKTLVSCIKNSIHFEGRLWKSGKNPENPPVGKVEVSKVSPMGRGGAFVETTQLNFKVGDIIELDIHASFGKVDGVGKVRWIRQPTDSLPSGLGIEILNVGEESQVKYEKWLNENHIKPYIPLKAA